MDSVKLLEKYSVMNGKIEVLLMLCEWDRKEIEKINADLDRLSSTYKESLAQLSTFPELITKKPKS